MDKAIYSILTGDAGVSALISTRCYPVQSPQNPTYPMIVYTPTSGEYIESLSTSTTIRREFFEVLCAATSYSAVAALAELVITALNRYHGTASSITVEDVFLSGKACNYDDTLGVYIMSLDFSCMFRV